jgi:hypothetical protein
MSAVVDVLIQLDYIQDGAPSILYICVCMHVCMYVRMHVCMYVRMHVCKYVYIYVCMYACMYVCIPA